MARPLWLLVASPSILLALAWLGGLLPGASLGAFMLYGVVLVVVGALTRQ